MYWWEFSRESLLVCSFSVEWDWKACFILQKMLNFKKHVTSLSFRLYLVEISKGTPEALFFFSKRAWISDNCSKRRTADSKVPREPSELSVALNSRTVNSWWWTPDSLAPVRVYHLTISVEISTDILGYTQEVFSPPWKTICVSRHGTDWDEWLESLTDWKAGVWLGVCVCVCFMNTHLKLHVNKLPLREEL